MCPRSLGQEGGAGIKTYVCPNPSPTAFLPRAGGTGSAARSQSDFVQGWL